MTALTLHDFPGGLSLPPNKAQQTAQPISTLALPDRVWVPLLQHRGKLSRPCVKRGDKVGLGSVIGLADGAFSANVHATIAGTVGRIESRVIAHRSGLSAPCVEILADREQAQDFAAPLDTDFRLVDPNILRQRVADAGIVGLGGASFPTALKLTAEADQSLHTLVLNGAECAPYISCDEMLMRERAGDIMRGAQSMLHILQINRCMIALEEDKVLAIDAMQQALEDLSDSRFTLCLVHAKYPEGGERQLIQVLSGKEIPSDGLPVDIGYLCHNVGTAAAVFDLFATGRPLTSRIVTVCGDGVAQPQNVIAPFGTSIQSLLDHAGGLLPGSHRLIVGGPMMGFTVDSTDVPIDKGCNCILVMPEENARQLNDTMPCIRCGECETVCPASLLPQQLYYHARSSHLERLPDFHLFDCIECGCCDYVCPSNLPLTQYFRYAKDELWFRSQQQARSNQARERYEQREQRLLRQQQERDAARAERQQATRDAKQKQSDILAAVARAKARKKGDSS
ncbi:MAG: electron transport complex subunit RsxC [Pseudomonadota bacterium]